MAGGSNKFRQIPPNAEQAQVALYACLEHTDTELATQPSPPRSIHALAQPSNEPSPESLGPPSTSPGPTSKVGLIKTLPQAKAGEPESSGGRACVGCMIESFRMPCRRNQ